jgi:hypothetical protein
VVRLYWEWSDRWVLEDGGRKQKTDPYGLSFWKRHWLNSKDEEEEEEEEEGEKEEEEEEVS